MANKGTEYEQFVQEIYQALLDNEDIKSISVEHDVDLEGRSGCKHQIDVYWEYEIAGIKQKVAIECKDYNTSDISIGKIRDFYGALSDIGNINGIFVCKNGYQSGAKKFADFYGINLQELRTPTSEDWTGRIETIQINITECNLSIKDREPIFDLQWFKEKFGMPQEGQSITFEGISNEVFIFDKNGNPIKSIQDLENALPHELKVAKDQEYTYDWEDAFIETNEFGKIKIRSMKFIYDILQSEPEVLTISGKDMAKAILKDVRTNEVQFFYKDGRINDKHL
jgi:hypothetical protein